MNNQPKAGDAVRLAGVWRWGMVGDAVKLGDITVLDGSVDHPDGGFSIIFNAHSFFDGRVCSSSGGPGTIWTPATELHPTGQTVVRPFWKWKDGIARAHNGLEYQLEVPLWDWIPVEGETETKHET